MRLVILSLLMAGTALGDLVVWTASEVLWSIPVDTRKEQLLLVMEQYEGWGYTRSIAMVIPGQLLLPDSFCISGDALVSHVDYLDTLTAAGSVQVLAESGVILTDTPASSLPDTLVLRLISSPFRSAPDTTSSIWVLEEGLFRLLPPGDP